MLDSRGFLTVPMAIILAALIIAGAVIYATGPSDRANNDQPANTANVLDNLAPVDANDHIWGSRDAAVKVVEFSDTECPFCKRFHYTMKNIMAEYAESGQVAWVYRHFPIDSLHPKARKESQALECAADLGGNEKFWLYLDRLFEVTPSNNGLDLNELPNIASYVGLDRSKFEACLGSSKFLDVIQADYDEAVKSGARGTPFSVVVAADGQKFSLDGAQPYSAVKQIIDAALSAK
ncbi:MAG: thioredoxin domain-containing protein [bacterium]|nr:thioredoxin domain-containing protein [bacterium]